MADKSDDDFDESSSGEEDSDTPQQKDNGNDDDEDEFAFGGDGKGDDNKAPAKIYKDQHFDEALAVSEVRHEMHSVLSLELPAH